MHKYFTARILNLLQDILSSTPAICQFLGMCSFLRDTILIEIYSNSFKSWNVAQHLGNRPTILFDLYLRHFFEI